MSQIMLDFTLETDGIFTLRDSLSHHVFEKHNTIDQLPPVLHMQLKRSRYDLKKDRVEKVCVFIFTYSFYYIIFETINC